MCDSRVSIIEGVRACLEFNLARAVILSRPDAEPAVGDNVLHDTGVGSTLLSVLPERLRRTRTGGPWGPGSFEPLLSDPSTASS